MKRPTPASTKTALQRLLNYATRDAMADDVSHARANHAEVAAFVRACTCHAPPHDRELREMHDATALIVAGCNFLLLLAVLALMFFLKEIL